MALSHKSYDLKTELYEQSTKRRVLRTSLFIGHAFFELCHLVMTWHKALNPPLERTDPLIRHTVGTPSHRAEPQKVCLELYRYRDRPLQGHIHGHIHRKRTFS